MYKKLPCNMFRPKWVIVNKEIKKYLLCKSLSWHYVLNNIGPFRSKYVVSKFSIYIYIYIYIYVCVCIYKQWGVLQRTNAITNSFYQ